MEKVVTIELEMRSGRTHSYTFVGHDALEKARELKSDILIREGRGQDYIKIDGENAYRTLKISDIEGIFIKIEG